MTPAQQPHARRGRERRLAQSQDPYPRFVARNGQPSVRRVGLKQQRFGDGIPLAHDAQLVARFLLLWVGVYLGVITVFAVLLWLQPGSVAQARPGVLRRRLLLQRPNARHHRLRRHVAEERLRQRAGDGGGIHQPGPDGGGNGANLLASVAADRAGDVQPLRCGDAAKRPAQPDVPRRQHSQQPDIGGGRQRQPGQARFQQAKVSNTAASST